MGSTDKEIERKYLLRELPAAVVRVQPVEIDQGYIPGKKIHERIRARSRCVRREVFPDGQAGFRVSNVSNSRTKRRSYSSTRLAAHRGAARSKAALSIAAAGGVWEIDEFLDRQLVLAEIEFKHADQKIDIPEFISSVLGREVTGRRAIRQLSIGALKQPAKPPRVTIGRRQIGHGPSRGSAPKLHDDRPRASPSGVEPYHSRSR